MKWDGKIQTARVHTALEQMNILPVRTMARDNCTVDELTAYIKSVFKHSSFKPDYSDNGYELCIVDDHAVIYLKGVTFENKFDNSLTLTWRQCAKELISMNKQPVSKEPKRMKWDETENYDNISVALLEFITEEERELAKRTSYGDLTSIIRKAHMKDEKTTSCCIIKGLFDKVEITMTEENILYWTTWNKAAKAIHKRINKDNGDDNMGKIDFKAMKNARKAAEDSIPDTTSEELAKTYNDVWGTDRENVIQIEVTRLVPFTDEEGNTQPFKLNPQKVAQIKASAEDVGIIEPLRVRRKGDIYEIISGHHRLAAAKELGQLTVPCLVGDLDDETAYKVLAESNIQRSVTLPSEYAKIFARYMKLRAEKDLTVEEIAKKFDVSRKTIYRYVALNDLMTEIQELVDSGIINIHAVELLKDMQESEQEALWSALTDNKVRLSVPMAKKLKKASDEALLEYDDIKNIILGIDEKPEYKNKVYSKVSTKYNISMTEKELDDLTAKLLDEYFAKKKKTKRGE